MTSLALAGIQVLELCSFVAGPFCARLLADMGAEVTKIEPPEGDQARRCGPFYQDLPHQEASLLFIYLNSNKRGITLDVSVPKGRELFLELIQGADVLVEDRPPKLVKELGLDYPSLRRANKRIIVTSITPFGQWGPHRDYKAYYLNTYHAGGDGYLLPGGRLADTLYPHREPIKAGGYLGEYQAGLSAAVATMGAILARLLDGPGGHVDLSKQEALLNLNGTDHCMYPDRGFLWTRRNRDLPHYLGGLYRCRDGFWELLIQEERQWRALVDLMGHPSWIQEERFSTHDGRVAQRQEIDERIEAWAMNHTRQEIYHGLQQRGCAAGPVYSPQEVTEDEQLALRGFFVEAEHSQIGKFKLPSAPYRFSRTPWSLRRPAPALGEHNREVYCDGLGYTTEELARLGQQGVI